MKVEFKLKIRGINYNINVIKLFLRDFFKFNLNYFLNLVVFLHRHLFNRVFILLLYLIESETTLK